MPRAKEITRKLPCIICGESITAYSTTSPHPEAPEMVQLLSDQAWIGIEGSAHQGESPKLLVVCSVRCLDELLEE